MRSMLRFRSRVLVSLASGIAVVGLTTFLVFFSGHPDEKSIADFHRSPFVFALVWAALGAAIAVVMFIVLSLIAWGLKRLPARALETEGSVRQLYSPNQAFGAALLGGPLAAVSLIKTNYLTLGNPAYAKKSVIVGWSLFLVFLTVIIALVYWDVSLKGIGTGIGIATASAGKSLVSSLQRTKQAILESDRYSFKSNWRVVGLGLLYLAATYVILFIATFALVLAGYHLPK